MEYVIFGSGGFAREVAEMVGTERVLGFLDDDATRYGTIFAGLPVLGGADWVSAHPGAKVFLGVGSPKAKRSIAERLRPLGACFPPFVHPRAIVGSRVTLGNGVIVCANAVLTCDIAAADFAAFNLGATVGHDSEIGSYATVSPGCNLSGYTVLEDGVELGTNAATIPGVRVGAWAVIGAGAVVTRDVPPGVVAVGVPARPLRAITSPSPSGSRCASSSRR